MNTNFRIVKKSHFGTDSYFFLFFDPLKSAFLMLFKLQLIIDNKNNNKMSKLK